MSHIEKDPFDDQLQAMFAEAALPEQPEDADVFTRSVIERLDKPQKARFLALGGAGATGSAVAGTQIESLLNAPVTEMGGVLGEALAMAGGTETMVTLLMAMVVGAVGYFLPRQLQAA